MTAGVDRRRAPRRVPHASEPVARLRLRAGRELTVVNVAAAGALVETEGRLLPGTCVDVHVMTAEGRELVRGRVVRAFVSGLWGDRVLYRGALAFDRHVSIAPASCAPGMPKAIPPAGSEHVSGNAFLLA